MNDPDPAQPWTPVHRDAVAIKNIAFVDVGHTSKGIVLYVEDTSSSFFSARCVQSCCKQAEPFVAHLYL